MYEKLRYKMYKRYNPNSHKLSSRRSGAGPVLAFNVIRRHSPKATSRWELAGLYYEGTQEAHIIKRSRNSAQLATK